LAKRLIKRGGLSARAHGEMTRILSDFGFGDLVAAAEEQERQEYATTSALEDLPAQLRARRELDRVILGWLAASNEHTELDLGQRRRLDDLIDFWTTLGMSRAPAFEPTGVYDRSPQKLKALIDLFISLSGLRGPVLSTQAQQMLTEMGEGTPPALAEDMLNMLGAYRPLSEWSAVNDSDEALEVLVPYLAVGRWLPPRVRQALAHRGLNADELGRLEAWLFEVRHLRQREFGLELVLALAGNDRIDSYLASDDPARRAAAGLIVAHKAHQGEHPVQVAQLIEDGDDEVRERFIDDLADRPIPETIRTAVLAADWTPRSWTCFECGETNSPGGGGCQSCRAVGGEPHKAVERLRKSVT
jgi:hypothetical protein